MGRLIDADKLKQHYSWWGGLIGDDYVSELVEQKKVFDTIVDVQPTVDAVPTEFHDKCMEIEIKKRMDLELNSERVVRCQDCQYFLYDKLYMVEGLPLMGNLVCEKWGNGCRTDENGYCFMGERKEDAEEE